MPFVPACSRPRHVRAQRGSGPRSRSARSKSVWIAWAATSASTKHTKGGPRHHDGPQESEEGRGFRLLWTWKFRRGRTGRPAVAKEICQGRRSASPLRTSRSLSQLAASDQPGGSLRPSRGRSVSDHGTGHSPHRAPALLRSMRRGYPWWISLGRGCGRRCCSSLACSQTAR